MMAAAKPNNVATRARNAARTARVSCRASRNNSVNVATQLDWKSLATSMDDLSPIEIMDHALATFGDEIAIAFSGAEDVAVIEYAKLTGRPFRVFSLDTGRLDKETYELFDAVEKHYGINIEYTFPDAQECMDLVREKGMFSFYEDGHQECCRVRKVRPLRRQLKTLKAWVTGQRKDQSPGTRAAVPVVEVDPVFEGLDGGEGSLIKYNPMSNASSADVWMFLRTMGVPTNKLHEMGYDSIGCQPCTKPVLPNQHEREGRWWWEDAAGKECGLHSGNIAGQESDDSAGEEGEKQSLYDSVTEMSKADLEALATDASSRPEKGAVGVLYAPWCQFCQALEEDFEAAAAKIGATGEDVKVFKFRADTEREFSADKFQLETFPRIVYIPGKSSTNAKPISYLSEKRTVDDLLTFTKNVSGVEARDYLGFTK